MENEQPKKMTPSERTMKWKRANPEKVKEQKKLYVERHREKVNEYQRNYQKMKRQQKLEV